MSFTVKFDTGEEVDFEKMPSPAVIEEVAGKLSPKVSASTETPAKQDFSVGRTISNIPKSGIALIKNMGTAALHPSETIPAVIRTAAGGMEKLTGLAPNEKDLQAFTAFSDFVKNRYGSLENLKQTIQNDPVGFAADISGVLSAGGGILSKAGAVFKIPTLTKMGKMAETAGTAIEPVGAAIKGASVAAKGAGKVLTGAIGITTGSGGKAAAQALFNPNETFLDAMRGKTGENDLVVAAKEGLQGIKDARRQEYIDQLQKIKNSTTQIDLTPIKLKLQNLLNKFNVKQVFDNEGNVTLDFSRSPINKSAANDVSEAVGMIEDWGKQPGDNTAVGMDILKRKLDDLYSESGEARALTTDLRNTVKSEIVKQVPEYAKLTKDYEIASNNLKDIMSAFSLKGKAGADTIQRKLMQILRQNFEFRNKLAVKVGEAANKDIPAMVAGREMSTWEPRGLARLGSESIGAGAAYAALKGTLNPAYLGGLVMASPRVMGEFLTLLGMGARTVGNTFNAIYSPKLAQSAFQAGRIKEKISK